jgi:uncharacterized protein
MTVGKVEIVRRIYDVWNRKDGSQEALDFISDELEYVNPPYAVHPGTRHGQEGWIAAGENLTESFDRWVHEPGEIIEHGDKVVVMATFRARGRGSSVDLEKFEPHIWTLREGKVVRFEWFNDRDEAMRAAGLED